MQYKWLPMSVKKYNNTLEAHGGTFLVDRDERQQEIWEVTNLADASEQFTEQDGCLVVVYYVDAKLTASQVYDVVMQHVHVMPDHEDRIADISEMWSIASHFMMGYSTAKMTTIR